VSRRSPSPYALRHTFASNALAAGVGTFELARYVGGSLVMIDRDYWHLVRGTDDAFRLKLDAYSAPLSARRRMRRVTDEPAKHCAGEQ